MSSDVSVSHGLGDGLDKGGSNNWGWGSNSSDNWSWSSNNWGSLNKGSSMDLSNWSSFNNWGNWSDWGSIWVAVWVSCISTKVVISIWVVGIRSGSIRSSSSIWGI